MGDNWITRMAMNAVAQPVANAMASAGSMAGGAVGGVGNAINGVGRGIESSIRYYGDGVKDYGNAIQDWTKAPGVRQGTAANPLGLSSTPAGGKLAFTGSKTKTAEKKPPIKAPRGDPRASAQKTLPASGKPAAKPASAARPKPVTASAPKAKTAPSPAVGGPVKKKISAESRPKPKVAAARTSAPKDSYGRGTAAGKNPLGL